MSDEISIRRALTIADYHACQDAQRRAWGITGEEYVVPVATMVGAQLHGGLVLGAFDGAGSAVGVSFGFLGRLEGELCLYSQLTGVVPGQQGRGIVRLKEVQREFARSAGLEQIVWAFDPLQAGNAHFNLGRLGARSRTYVENMYGLRTDALNAGVPTDRLIVAWTTTEQRPRCAALGAAEIARLPRVVEGVAGPDGALDPITTGTLPAGERVLLEIPAEIGRLRAEAPELAERWRRAAAGAFLTLFAAGFVAVDFLRIPTSAGAARNFYLLDRDIPTS